MYWKFEVTNSFNFLKMPPIFRLCFPPFKLIKYCGFRIQHKWFVSHVKTEHFLLVSIFSVVFSVLYFIHFFPSCRYFDIIHSFENGTHLLYHTFCYLFNHSENWTFRFSGNAITHVGAIALARSVESHPSLRRLDLNSGVPCVPSFFPQSVSVYVVFSRFSIAAHAKGQESTARRCFFCVMLLLCLLP